MEANLAEQLENNKKAMTLDFSREVHKSYGDVKLLIPIQEALLVYKQMNDELTGFSDNFDQTFVKRGLDNINKNLLPRGTEYFLINAHASNIIREIMGKYELFTPFWVPDTFLTEDKQSEHQKTCYFKWGTVSPCHIPNNMQGYLKLLLSDEIRVAPVAPKSKPTHITSNRSNVKSINSSKERSSPVAEVKLCPLSEHGRFVAKKYLWLMDSAAKRGLDFSLSIEELSTLLRDHVCYYTKEKLVSFPHEKGENNDHLPDNYLTIDRKDNDLGYVSGNVVACSKEINTLKNQMSEQDFQQAIALKTLMDQANFNPAQMNAFATLMKPKG